MIHDVFLSRIAADDHAGVMSSKRLDSISDYRRHGYALRIDCLGCGHMAKIDPNVIVKLCMAHGWSKQLAYVERRLRCTKCGKRDVRCGPAFVN
jgi:hypothetical protein